MAFAVKITDPSGNAYEVQLRDGDTSIGRDPSNTLVLSGRGVSRKHAKLVVEGERLTLVDLGSTYGTRVNEMPTLRREIKLGDRLTVGMHQLEVCQPSKPGVTAPALVREPAYFPDERTRSPAEQPSAAPPPDLPSGDVHHRQTVRLDVSAINFVLDNPDEQGQAVEVLSTAADGGDLVEAVERLNTGRYQLEKSPVSDATATMTPRSADLHALVLMYKVTSQLGDATDLDSFLNPVADMVMEEAQANTVVILLNEPGGELAPVVIRHRGALDPGEVPVSRSILELVTERRSTVTSADVGTDERIQAGKSLALYNIRAVVAAPLLLRGVLRGVLYLHRAGPIPFSQAEGNMVTALASLMASGIERAELKERISSEKQQRRQLERFHPPELVDQASAATGDGAMSLNEHRATALVCDIKGFPELVGHVSPKQMASVLHDYYELLYEKIFANGGSLVKLHDGWALALFGMHSSVDRDAMWALEAARALCDEFEALRVMWPESGALKLRCALDTGAVVAGIVGSVERMEYAALGVPISTTSQIARRADDTCVLLTAETWSNLPQKRYRVEEVSLLPDRQVLRLLAGC